ncbi:MAG: DNA polymerase III subunit gamma/tau [Acidimicrobiia bacterium]|nr:DNA polymerase III subunit gamma/tau [Acidimicrobiia bacterium]
MVHQSLYLRYRPGRFGEIVGQEHVVAALRNAVGTDRVGHAYLFSGPRGTGKTSTARILAKALNCENLTEGEPCGTCSSCTSIAAGTSYELHELDAASNNKVDDIRELISRVAIGTPGRVKVYVLDEVHMLTTGAENALLKTLEEPPPHVTFVLCTTEPHKVAPTIRSRTQHLHFELLDVDDLERHVRAVATDAGLEISDADVAYVLDAGGGSARDTLSALDATAAAGRAPDGADAVTALLEAVATADAAAALGAADAAARAGREPRVLGEAVLGRLRNAFLASVGAPLEHLAAAERAAAEHLAGRLRPRALTLALELLGQSLVAMREAPDPRVDLDLALVRLTDPEVGLTLQSLAERVERLERAAAGAPAADAAPSPTMARRAPASAAAQGAGTRPGGAFAEARRAHSRAKPPEPPTPGPPEAPQPGSSSESHRRAPRELLGQSDDRPVEPEPPEPPEPHARAPMNSAAGQGAAPGRPLPGDAQQDRGGSPPEVAGPPPDRDEAVLAWVEEILPSLSSVSKTAGARLATGRFLPNAPGALRLAFATPGALSGCAKYRSEVEAAFGRCFGHSVAVEFTADDKSTPEPPSSVDGGATVRSRYLGEVTAAAALPRRGPAEDRSGVVQVQQAFPGSRLVELEAG